MITSTHDLNRRQARQHITRDHSNVNIWSFRNFTTIYSTPSYITCFRCHIISFYVELFATRMYDGPRS